MNGVTGIPITLLRYEDPLLGTGVIALGITEISNIDFGKLLSRNAVMT